MTASGEPAPPGGTLRDDPSPADRSGDLPPHDQQVRDQQMRDPHGRERSPEPRPADRRRSAEPQPVPPGAVRPHRRWSLRARLIALVVAVASVALIAVDVLLPINVRTNLMESKDNALRSVVASGLPSQTLDQLTRSAQVKGELGISLIRVGSTQVISPIASDPSAQPEFSGAQVSPVPATVRDARTDATYRYMAVNAVLQGTGEPVLVAFWVPLADVTRAVGSVVFTELLISFGLLLLLGATASVIIRRELKPLEAMATAADDIAGGDLDRRVYPGDAGTEVGRLGFALNGMLDAMSGLLAEREANERRMRQFLADASHELRTPVAAVRGYTELYQAGALPDEQTVGRAMQRMGFEAERMGALVGDLLTLIQADAENDAERGPVDLAEVLTGVVDDAAVIDRTRTWRLVGTDSAGSAVVLGDRLRLHQLFANLLGNVRTHTPAGTTATVTLALAQGEATVTVADDGPGVPTEDLPKLFDRFFRVDASRSREKGGTGLGLSIVAAIVRSHRGRIVASHTPGGGLTTTVVLPRLLPGAPAPATGAAEPAAEPSGRAARGGRGAATRS